MRIAVAQLNTVVGDFEGNLRKILETIARVSDVDLVVFPELSLVGYPPKDLLERPALAQACEDNLRVVAQAVSQGPSVVVGGIDSPDGALLPRNVAFLIHGGEVHRVAKRLLPTYDVFDEVRHFSPGKADQVAVIQVHGVRIGLLTCEDMWNDAELWGSSRLYATDPVKNLVASGAQLVINISASPYNIGKIGIRGRIVRHAAKRHGIGVLMCNLVGGNDSLVFDGSSMLVNPGGELVGVGRSFAEDLFVVEWVQGEGFRAVPDEVGDGARALGRIDWPLQPEPCQVDLSPEALDELEQALQLGLGDYMGKLGFNRAVLGLSGGVDSALTAYLAARVLGGEHVFAVELPSRYTSELSRTISRQLGRKLGLTPAALDIEPIQQAFLRKLEPWFRETEPDVTEENLQARIRGTVLMAFSNKFGNLVLSTGNKSEMAVGYCTLYGDMNGGLAVISDVFKQQVYGLCRRINERAGEEVIPRAVIERPASAELRAEQTDQDTLPPYARLDPILVGILEDRLEDHEIAEKTDNDVALVRRVRKLVDTAEFKRQQAAPTLRVSRKAWHGRRYPIIHRFR